MEALGKAPVNPTRLDDSDRPVKSHYSCSISIPQPGLQEANCLAFQSWLERRVGVNLVAAQRLSKVWQPLATVFLRLGTKLRIEVDSEAYAKYRKHRYLRMFGKNPPVIQIPSLAVFPTRVGMVRKYRKSCGCDCHLRP
jgi:hypothetical protein